MILYCDTSALVKLYVVESHSAEVKALVGEAEAVALSRIAWVEFHAAVARRAREVAVDAPAMESARASLAQDWAHYLVLAIGQDVVEQAAEFADAFALRAYDAVHLSAARKAMVQSDLPLTFACFDRRLNKAAKLLEMSVAFP